ARRRARQKRARPRHRPRAPARDRATSPPRPPDRRRERPWAQPRPPPRPARTASDCAARGRALRARHVRPPRGLRRGGASGQGGLGLRRQEDPCGKGYSPLTTLAVSGSALTVRFLPSRLATYNAESAAAMSPSLSPATQEAAPK